MHDVEIVALEAAEAEEFGVDALALAAEDPDVVVGEGKAVEVAIELGFPLRVAAVMGGD